MTVSEEMMRYALEPNLPRLPDISKLQDSIVRAKRDDENRQAIIAGRFDAQDAHKYLMSRVDEFQKSLASTEEIGIQLANFGLASQIHIRAIAFQNPNLIEFHGKNAEGNDVCLIQHISQLNFLLVAVKPLEDKPFRIGFVWAASDDEQPTPA